MAKTKGTKNKQY